MTEDDPTQAGGPGSEPGSGQLPHDVPEEELRARLEEELKRITVRDVLLQTVVSLVNLAGQRLGLGEGGDDTRDLNQVRMAIEAVRALLPLLEEENAEQVRPVRDALSQLQMAYAREASAAGPSKAGGEPGGEPGGPEPPPKPRPQPGGPGGLWVPPGSTR
jgi:hypothetical protein